MKGVPLLYISRHTIVLESPSEKSKKIAAKKKKETLAISDRDNKLLKQLKDDQLGPIDNTKRKRKKLKGPNPLSCLKSRKAKNEKINEGVTKRRRIRVKIAKHVKEIWINEGKWPIKKFQK